MKYIFFDCETGGLNPDTHSLLTVYFGLYDDKFYLIDELDLQLKPDDMGQLRVEQGALNVTGINLNEHLNDPKTVTYTEGARLLEGFLNKHKIKGKRRSFRPCGYNVEFDIKFLQTQLLPEDIWRKHIHHNPLDMLRILTFLQDIGFLPKELGKLESVVNYFNIPMGQAHNAKEDIRMTVDVYKAMRNMLISKKGDLISNDMSSLLEIIERG